MKKKKGLSYRIYCKRIKWACKFGKLEHNSSRLGILVLMIAIVLHLNGYDDIALYLSLVTFILFLIYLISHKIEKKLYPGNFRF